MTAGITGVFWLPRMAEVNSVALNAGAHGIPISAAATAWGALTGAWIDATATVTRVMAELGVGMQGVNGIAALGKLVPFTSWAEQQGVLAAAMGSKAAANATAYTVASLAMPSIPEIVVTNGAVVASANPPGALSGALEVAEVTKNAMDIRAALVMETYEAATSATVLTPGEFITPPTVAQGAGTADAPVDQGAQTLAGDPVSGAIAAVTSFVQNPGVVSAATQAANVAGSVLGTGVSTVGNVAGSAVAAVGNAVAAPAVSGVAPMSMLGTGAAVTAAAGATRSASFVSPGVSVGSNNNPFKLPEGWGSGSPAATAPTTESAVRVDSPAATRPAATAPTSPLMGHGARSTEDDESEHNSKDYLRSADTFNDGRYAADGVIGAQSGPSK